MGSQPKKEKDHKRKDIMMGTYRRQISSEQELWQERFMDILWYVQCTFHLIGNFSHFIIKYPNLTYMYSMNIFTW
jgi:hypothetical protein